MFERFTEKAIKVIMLAQEESRRLGHNFVGTEQLLLALIGEGTGIAAKVLKSWGIALRDARIEVEKIIGRGPGFVAVEIPFTLRAKRVLELALEESRRLGHSYIGTEHILLGLIREGEGLACRVLEILGIDLQSREVRTQVIAMLGETTDEDSRNLDNAVSGGTTVSRIRVGIKIEPLINRLASLLRESTALVGQIKSEFRAAQAASSDVSNALNQLPDSPEPEQPGIKELLTRLQAAIDADTDLTPEDKAEALEQVILLVEAGQNPTEERRQKYARTAIKILKGTVADLPTTNHLVEECNQVLPAIARTFGLG